LPLGSISLLSARAQDADVAAIDEAKDETDDATPERDNVA
jgi:hypothetical protein